MREGKEIGALWKPGRGGIGVLQDERGFDTPGFVVECIPCVGCGNVGHWKSRMGRRVQGTRGGAGWWRVADMRADFPVLGPSNRFGPRLMVCFPARNET